MLVCFYAVLQLIKQLVCGSVFFAGEWLFVRKPPQNKSATVKAADLFWVECGARTHGTQLLKVEIITC